MIYVLILCGGLWALGWALGIRRQRRVVVIALVWLAAFAWLSLPLDPASDDLRVWVLASLVTAIGSGYAFTLKYLKARLRNPDLPGIRTQTFQQAELERYARHIMLREIGGPGQKAMKSAKVLVIGAGGLGSPALMYLAAAGVGVIGVVDDDVVDASNLQRQIIHTTEGVGTSKVLSARAAMLALNPFVEVRAIQERFGEGNAGLLSGYDLILDGSDNFDTRYLVNRLAVRAGKPLISAAITQWEGQISLYDPARGTPCYQCIFPHRPAPGMVPTCAEAGVAAPLPGVIGSMMAIEAVKDMTGAGEGLRGRLMIYDALYSEVRVIGIKRRDDCEVCGASH
jgi:molybdopterin/thiamine biosynthesis adenylyltransferase